MKKLWVPFSFPLTGDASLAEAQGCAFAAQGPSKGGTDPHSLCCRLRPGNRGHLCEQLRHPGACAHPLCAAALGRGVGLRGQLGCTQGTPSLLGSEASGTPGREGQTPCPGSPMAEGEAGLCLFLLWPEAVCKLSSCQPMRNSNNQRHPQHEPRWSERPSCQMWRQRTDPGPLRVFSHFHRSGVWGPILGAVGTSSHDNPRFCYCFQYKRW